MKIFYIFISFLIQIKEIKLEENDIIIKKKCMEYCSIEGGNCDKFGICKCKSEYDTIITDKNIIFCNYKKFNRTISASLELMIGNGFGHFYCQRYINGFLLITCNIIIFYLCTSIIISAINFDRSIGDNILSFTKTGITISSFLILFTFFWRIRDAIYFMTNRYKDGNGIDLY